MLVAVLVLSSEVGLVWADTWRLDKNEGWKAVSTKDKDKYLLLAARTEKLINTGQADALRNEWNKLKKEFAEIKEQDLNTFIQAEIFFCERKYSKAIRSYDKFLDKNYDDSALYQAALERQFSVAKAFLDGRKIRVLGIFKKKAYAEGIKIMDRITERAGDRPIAAQAAIEAAKHYEKRKRFAEAHLKWSEVSWQRQTGQIAKDALLGMARCKHAAYKGPNYNAANLKSAKTYYQDFELRYPEDARELGIGKIVKQIDEQMAYKQFTIGKYYQRTGKTQAANLYYDMVIRSWPNTHAAQLATEIFTDNFGAEKTKK
jgi:outer membrane protein assembly factor BamD (BamD/ComL family)